MSKGTHAAPYALVLVLLCVVHPLQVAVVAQPGPAASTKDYIIFPNARFWNGGQYLVSHGATERICREEGAILATDHSEATDAAINEVYFKLRQRYIYSYLGGDAAFSASEAQDVGSRCKEADNSTSIHCVYRWNRGLFDATTTNGIGEAFWRGSYRSTPGAGSMNDFPFRWIKDYPKFGFLYPISRRHYRESKRTWFDEYEDTGHEAAHVVRKEKQVKNFVLLCNIYVPTTSAPVPQPESDENASEELNGTNANETESEELNGTNTNETESEDLNGTNTNETASEELNGTNTNETASEELNGTNANETASEELNGTNANETASEELNGTNANETESEELNGTSANETASEELNGTNANETASEELNGTNANETESEELNGTNANETASEELNGTSANETESEELNGTNANETASEELNGTNANETASEEVNGTNANETASEELNGTNANETESEELNGTSANETESEELNGTNANETASEELNGTNANETESDDSSSGVSSTEAPAGKVNGGVLAVAILLPIIAIALLLLLWYFCFRRRDEKEDAPLSLREVYSPAECPSPVEAPLTSEGGGAAEGGSPNASPAVAQ